MIVATLKGEDSNAPKLILNGHVDVASVDDDQYWQYPPFQLTEVGGWLYGRGVSDMKGGMSSLFYVLERLNKKADDLKVTLSYNQWSVKKLARQGPNVHVK